MNNRSSTNTIVASITTASSEYFFDSHAPKAGDEIKEAANVAETNPHAVDLSFLSVISATYASTTLNVTAKNPLNVNNVKYHLEISN